MTPLRTLLSLVTVLVLAPLVPAQRIAPPSPATYDVQIRYRIRVGGNQRIVQYREMMGYLAGIDFKRTDTPEPNEPADSDADRMSGTLPSNRVADLLREPHVKTILLRPAGYKLPENPEQRVLVQLKLADNFFPNRQRELFFQALNKLNRIGLIEKVGYDHEGFTRILGTIPAAEVETLLGDLRLQPAGWLTPHTPIAELPEPIRDVNPIRVATVLAEPEGVPATADVPPAIDSGVTAEAKIAPDLSGAETRGPFRFEIVLTHAPGLDDNGWQNLLQTQQGVLVEGRIGPVVTVTAPAAAIRGLASSPEVATVRPPRAATLQEVNAPAANRGELKGALATTGLDRLHNLGFRGRGVRVAIIDTDFAGIGKALPKTGPVIDLTAVRNYTLLPDPMPEGAEPGRGARLASAVRLAAPDAELVLIRVDPAAMYQLLIAARYMHGDGTRPESLVVRNRELLDDNNFLRVERTKVTEERRAIQNDFNQDEEAVKRRVAVEARTVALAQQEQAFNERLARFFALEEALAELRKINIVVCPLAWDEGYPFDGSGPLSRYLDDVFYGRPRPKNPPPYQVGEGPAYKGFVTPAPFFGKEAGRLGSLAPTAPALWFQAAGNTRGQVWNGPLNDIDNNGVIEFAPPGLPVPKGRWSREINFLAWQPAGAKPTFDLPAGARVRLAFQWTEAHDASVSDYPGPDLYRTPLADLRLLVLRQRDPSGTKVGSDDFNVIARSAALPQLIERRGNWATYEHLVEFAMDAPGQVAVRLEGRIPPTTRPTTVPTLPIIERSWEAHGRLFVSMTGADGGKIVIGDYQPGLGGLGAPGNALLPRTFGAVDRNARPQPYSARGPPSGQRLMPKPAILAFDAGAGTEQSTAFAAGTMASMMSAGTIEAQKLLWLNIPPGGIFQVPPAWLEQVERRWPKTGRE
jgi:hypothetical protein